MIPTKLAQPSQRIQIAHYIHQPPHNVPPAIPITF